MRNCRKIKYVSTIIDQNLKQRFHIDFVAYKLRLFISRFMLYGKKFSDQQMNILYYALVQSNFSYGLLAWGAVLNIHLRKLEITKTWLLKIILKNKRTYPTETHALMVNPLTIICRKILLAYFKNKMNINKVVQNHT